MKISEAKLNHKESLINKLEGLQSSPKNFWNVAKEIYGTKKGDKIPTLGDGNTQYKTSEDNSNLLANYFASQCQNIAGAEEIESTDVPHEESSLQNISVTEAEVYSELKRLKLGKASGPDGQSNELLKIASRSLAPSMTMLFNKILRSSTYPDLWKRANVSPIYKKGNRQEKNNYRPVSLLPVAGKVLERLVFKRMYTYCMENNLLTWRNSGFKKMDSTTNQLVYIVNSIYENLDKNEDTCLVFLDQSKAFDRIHHPSLMHKIKQLGIKGPLFNLLESYLHNRKMRVVLDGAKSRWFNIFTGVPQGSILGPLLFLINVNDLVDNLECEISL